MGELELNLLKNRFNSFASCSFLSAVPPLFQEAGDLSHPTPYVPAVVVLQFVLQFPPVVVLTLPCVVQNKLFCPSGLIINNILFVLLGSFYEYVCQWTG